MVDDFVFLPDLTDNEKKILNGIARRFLLEVKEGQYDDLDERIQFAKRLIEWTERG